MYFSFSQIIDEFERASYLLIQKHEEDKKTFEEETLKWKNKYEQSELHLKNLEMAFNDVHQ